MPLLSILQQLLFIHLPHNFDVWMTILFISRILRYNININKTSRNIFEYFDLIICETAKNLERLETYFMLHNKVFNPAISKVVSKKFRQVLHKKIHVPATSTALGYWNFGHGQATWLAYNGTSILSGLNGKDKTFYNPCHYNQSLCQHTDTSSF